MGVDTSKDESVRRGNNGVAASIVIAAAIISGGVAWTGAAVGRAISCAGYLSSSSGADTWQAVALRRAQGDPLSEQTERTFLAPAVLAGCFVPGRKE